jgi:hypothetical protein
MDGEGLMDGEEEEDGDPLDSSVNRMDVLPGVDDGFSFSVVGLSKTSNEQVADGLCTSSAARSMVLGLSESSKGNSCKHANIAPKISIPNGLPGVDVCAPAAHGTAPCLPTRETLREVNLEGVSPEDWRVLVELFYNDFYKKEISLYDAVALFC